MEMENPHIKSASWQGTIFHLKVFDAIILPTIQRQLRKSVSGLYNLEQKFLAQDFGEGGRESGEQEDGLERGTGWLQIQKSFEQRKQ